MDGFASSNPSSGCAGERSDSESYLRILTNAPDVAWNSDINGHSTYVSPKVEAVLGYTKDEFCTGQQLRMGCIHPADFGRVYEGYQLLFKQQSSFDVEYRFRRKDGRWIWVQDRATTIHEHRGMLYADGFLCDITRRKEAEAELQFEKAFLEAQANSTIDGILVVDPGGGTHRLREPCFLCHDATLPRRTGRPLDLRDQPCFIQRSLGKALEAAEDRRLDDV